MKKLCYIAPEYDSKSPTHFAYLVDFIEELKQSFDLYLIVGREGRLKMIFKIFNACLKGHKDFYIHYSFFGAFVASLAVKIFGGRVFYWNCGLPWQYKRNFFRENFELLTYKLITFLVTGTEGLKKQYAEHYNLPLEKIKAMPNWINLERFKVQSSKFKADELKAKLNIGKEQKVILFAHRLSKRKGAHYLPEIARKLSAIIHNSSFIILVIGDGPERKNLEFRIRDLGLENRVRFLGSISNDQLASYYLVADVLIMPSEEEGFPHVLLEAMAAGAPFVAFDVGGIKEIVSPELREYVLPLGDLDSFVVKMKKILSDQGPAGRISESEMRRVAEFDINKVVNIFRQLFE